MQLSGKLVATNLDLRWIYNGPLDIMIQRTVPNKGKKTFWIEFFLYNHTMPIGCKKRIRHSKRIYQSYGFMCIFNSYLWHKRSQKCIFGALNPSFCLLIDKYTYVHEKIYGAHR